MRTPQDQIIDAAQSLPAGQRSDVEKREQRRHSYTALVALILSTPEGRRTGPMVMRAGDLSAGGIQVISSQPLPAGSQGVIQLVRSDGQFALVGIQVRHSRYVGDLAHRSGLEFIGLPDGFAREEFLDERGRLILFDPLLRQNCS